MWPYSYAACDVGTFLNQTAKDGTPEVTATGARDGGPLSFLPGQRVSACTCPGSDHPGPNVQTGRGVPEIDIFETQVDVTVFTGQVSQSFQIAPYNYQYNFDNSTPAATIQDSSITQFNSYPGGVYQQAVSAVTDIPDDKYDDQGYAPYAFEWWSNPSRRDEGYITWYSNGQQTWSATSASVGPDSITQISQRLVSEEPMVNSNTLSRSALLKRSIVQYIVFNLGLAPGFQKQDFKHLQFPSKMYVDYVRVYQREGVKNGLTCDPPSHPTSDYINKCVRLASYGSSILMHSHSAICKHIQMPTLRHGRKLATPSREILFTMGANPLRWF